MSLPRSEHAHAVELLSRVLALCFVTFVMGVAMGVLIARVFP